MSKIFTTEVKNYLYVIFGVLLIAISVVIFFVPNNFTTGGTPGAALLLHKLTGFSIGSMVIAINIPLLIWGYKYLGKRFAIRTIFAIILISLFIDLFSKYLYFPDLISNILLASIFGGLVIGLGVGLIIKGNASAGGSTVVARIVSANSHIKPAQVILIIDVIIVVSSIYVFKDLEKALWSIMSIYVTAKAIDVVLTGTLTTKVIHIATNKPELLSKRITQRLGNDGTILKGTALHPNQDKTLIFIVLDVKRLGTLRQIIQETDKEAFMIVMEASEMLGRGH
ncbi:YitT family protein [Poseidonibacter lekithochrous]|uniref:YitT family protein n=1 Tax=Poseidonibacter lekithochrous TaxID=1904463 RepID=UPI000D39B3A0|nr:YitT family protein [Poseidonibacter lekithochrous]